MQLMNINELVKSKKNLKIVVAGGVAANKSIRQFTETT